LLHVARFTIYEREVSYRHRGRAVLGGKRF
jgi:hypothetical protein